MVRIALLAAIALTAAETAWGQDAATLQTNLNIVWIVCAAALVFIMQAGFAALETGFVRAKNSINVSMKNFADSLVAMVAWYAVGHGVMFGHTWGGWIGISGFGLDGMHTAWGYAFFLFEVAFAGAVAKIVSGAAAERMQFEGFLVVAAVMRILIYPVYGHWAWGGTYFHDDKGWLAHIGFLDFAGGSVVHSTGGWVALVVAAFLGPRLGKYDAQGRPQKISGYDLPFATLGCFILWLGWFGFNGGSTLIGDGSITKVIANTNIAAGTGGMVGLIISRIVDKKSRVEKIINGALGGIVGITAGCSTADPLGAVVIGAGGGVVVMFVEWLLESKLKIDDPLGAVPVHLGAGIWGTLSLALFSPVESLPAGSHLAQLGIQAIGVAACAAWAVPTTILTCWVLKKTGNLRVSRDEEITGLNLSEHQAKLPWTDTVDTINAIVNDNDLSRRVDVDHNSEAGIVAERFNILLDELEKRIDQEQQHLRQLETKVKERTQSISDLLDTTGQGFLAFGKDYRVQPEYSRACDKLFGKPITGVDVTELLYGQNGNNGNGSNGNGAGHGKHGPAQVRALLDLIFSGNNPDVIMTLLPQELAHNDRILQVEYKAAVMGQEGLDDKVMIVLTDITQKKELEAKLKTDSEWNSLITKIALDKDGFLQFLRETRRLRGFINQQLSRPIEQINLVEVYRHVHSIKGGAAMYGLERVAEQAHAVESRIDSLRSRRADLSAEAIAEVKAGVQEMEALLNKSLEQINSVLPEEERTARERLYQIPVSKIDQFRRYLGQELAGDAASKVMQAFDRLQRQPIGKVFRQYALAAKELARRLDKDVEVRTQGGDVEVPFDKLEPLFSSMVHLIRNAVDHGLEAPDQRRRLGKPEAGRLVLGAERDGNGLTLTVSDDGTGINVNLVRSTAIRIGMLDSNAAAEMEPGQVLKYIFMPGFSTKEKATLTSGRGVGLDAVKASLDPLGGRIQVVSRTNHGTTIRMLIPAM